VICHCPTAQTFSGAWLISHGPDDFSANDTNTIQVQIVTVDAAGNASAPVAQGSATLTGGERILPLTDGAIKPLAKETIPLTGASIAVTAGHSVSAAIVAVNAGADFPACTIGLTPA